MGDLSPLDTVIFEVLLKSQTLHMSVAPLHRHSMPVQSFHIIAQKFKYSSRLGVLTTLK